MIQIVSIAGIKKDDVILIEGFGKNELAVVEVEEVTEDFSIVPRGYGGLDYSPEDTNNIVRLGTINQRPLIEILTTEKS